MAETPSKPAAPKAAPAATGGPFSSSRVSDIIGVYKLDKEAMTRISGLPGMNDAFIYLVIAGILSGLMSTRVAGAAMGTAIIGGIITGIIGMFIAAGVIHLAAGKLLGGKGEFRNYFNVIAHTAVFFTLVALILVAISPALTTIVGLMALWLLVVNVVVVKVVYGFTTGRAIGAIILGIVLLFVIQFALAATVGFAALGMLAL